MRNTLNCYSNSLEAYYNIIKKYCAMKNEAASVYFNDEQFLEYVYEQASNEFDDGEKHAAIEYKSPWATVIISTAEFIEQFVDDMIEDDEEFNGLLTLYYHSKEIPL